MKVAIIGRGTALYYTAKLLYEHGHEIKVVVTADSPSDYRHSHEDFYHFAMRAGAKFELNIDLAQDNPSAEIASLDDCDIGISVNYPRIIPQEFIDLFKFGVLNAHGGDLPKYKGNACQAWAILEGEKRIGLCIHKMVGNILDAGDIVARKYYYLDTQTRIGEIYQWMEIDIPKLFLSAIQNLKDDGNYIIKSLEQQLKENSFRCFPRNPCDGEIDWSLPAIKILRLINASSEPYMGAFCKYREKIVHIWRASIPPKSACYLAVPGQIVDRNDREGWIDVACSSSELRVHSMSLESGPPTLPTSIVKGIRHRLY